jgi:hypothetical protein
MIASRKTLLVLIGINAALYLSIAWSGQKDRDFRAFYFAGETARHDPRLVYDLEYQRRAQQTEFDDQNGFNPFFHPPHELLLFVPLSMLPYGLSLNLWRALSIVFIVAAGALMARAIGAKAADTTLLMGAIHAVPLCLLAGQDSTLLLLLMAGCFYLLKTERDIAAAAVLALALFKPQIPVIFAIAMIAAGKRRFFVSFAAIGAALTAGSVAWTGTGAFSQILRGERLGEVGLGISYMPTVRGFLAMAGLDSRWLAAALLAAAVGAMITVWNKARSLEFAAASSICVACLFSIYLYDYDLALLGIPITLIAGKLDKKDTPLLAALTSTPLSQLLYFLHAVPVLAAPLAVLSYRTVRLRPEPEGATIVAPAETIPQL